MCVTFWPSNYVTYKLYSSYFRLNFENIPICTLPRESRLIFVLYGSTTEPTDNDANTSNESGQKATKVELGWASLQFFDYNRFVFLIFVI